MSERKFGPFVVGELIGVGGMGVVYRAVHPETGKTAALKLLPPGLNADPKIQQRFEREIGILKRLQHPNIVRYYGGGFQGGQRWYAMEFIDGGSLQDVLKRRGRLTPLQAVQAGRQLCAALEHAHNAGIIHRDLKPANLLLTSQGRLKLGDFGIARDTESTALTGAGRAVGTCAYMAPEQIQGSEHIDRRTDLYATGCVLYELLCGETPFTESNPAAMLMAHIDSIPHSVCERCPECPPALARLISRLLEKQPEDRPWDALAVHTDLGDIQQQMKQGGESSAGETGGVVSAEVRRGRQTTVSGGGSATKEASRGRKKKRVRGAFYEQVWFLSLCLLLLTGLVVWLLRGPGEQDLYRSAAAAMQQTDPVTLDDARRKFVLPYLQQYPDGQHAQQMRQWLDEIDTGQLLLQAERRLRGNRDGRNSLEMAVLAALRAERQEPADELVVLEQFQAVLELTEPAGARVESDGQATEQRRLWRLVAERRQAAVKTPFLQREDLLLLISVRFAAAEKLRQSGSETAARQIYQRFVVMFSDEPRLGAWRDCARERAEGRVAELPAF